MLKKAVIWDMDGLMFDTQSVYNEAYIDIGREEFGIRVPEEMLLALMGTSGEDMNRNVLRFFPEIDAPRFVRRSYDLMAERVKKDLRFKPGLVELLDYLREQGYVMAIASGSERKVVEGNLETSGLGDYFADYLCGDEVVKGKPFPEIYERTAAKIGVLPSACFVFEDSPNGLIAADRAGCTPVMVPDVVQPTPEIRKICAGIYPSLHEVRAALADGSLRLRDR